MSRKGNLMLSGSRLQYGSRHTFQFGPLLNSGLFSSHWLEHRLCLEPEWRELKDAAKECLSQLCTLWRVQKTRVALYGDEDTLKRSFIDPVFALLGWKLKPEPLLQSREPDYALFSDDAALDAALRAGRASPEFWNYPLLAAEAKAWDVRLDRPRTVNGKREYPPEQMEWYLNHSQLDFGILTNGRLWRLVPRNYEVYHRRFEAFLQADLAALLDGAIEGTSDFTKAEWYFYAGVPMMVVRERTRERLMERTVPVSAGIPPGFDLAGITYEAGAVYPETSKGERRASGSYYTPDHIVTHIVEQTLGPLCNAVSDALQAEVGLAEQEAVAADGAHKAETEARLAALKQDYGLRILRLRVLDPAMGSGHFLLRACQFLAEDIATHPYSEEPAMDGRPDESAVNYWKRRVVECCLYGVDLNPMAVELAELALWLETVAVGRPLTFLAHHVRTGNSLIGARVGELGVLPGEIELRGNELKRQLEEKLSLLLGPLEVIRAASSDRLDDVKSKDRLYRGLEKARAPFRDVADLWCSTFSQGEQVLTEAQYQEVLEALGKPRRLAELAATDWFRSAKQIAQGEDLRPFHWELEFPEIFFAAGGRRADAGFDAVIGNPPYDVLSERESGRNLAVLRAFIDREPVYRPTKRGKNNLYKLFICRALDLLAEGGYFSFITPMAILGDDQAADLRRHIVSVGSFTGVEAFPQKDEPAKRVFPEAKLSTAVFAMRKGAPRAANQPSFRAAVHPAATIDGGSPSLILTTAQIPLYDPANCGVVSCSQADWDLATRIMQTGRMARLREFAEFFQGEVNETNERKRGTLAAGPEKGTLVNRGAGICLYVLRPELQGDDLYVNVEKFLEGKGEATKAYHHLQRRVVLQESSPQNNFRRIISAFAPCGRFFNHTVNYCPEASCSFDLRFIVAILNTKLADWYFRLGSTNAHVSHYQLYNLPCPRFAEPPAAKNGRGGKAVCEAVAAGDLAAAWRIVEPISREAPFSHEVQQAIIAAVERIMAIEEARENMARKDRSALHPDAQPYQDLIDRLFYRMAGLTDDESAGLEERLANML